MSQATAVLKEFYRKAATATALVPAFWQISKIQLTICFLHIFGGLVLG